MIVKNSPIVMQEGADVHAVEAGGKDAYYIVAQCASMGVMCGGALTHPGLAIMAWLEALPCFRHKTNMLGYHALHAACRRGDLLVIRHILREGRDWPSIERHTLPTAITNEGSSCLDLVRNRASMGDTSAEEVLKALLQAHNFC